MVYVDTSALLKRYIAEPGSDDLDEFLRKHNPVDISRLAVTEMRCALARRRRTQQISSALEVAAFKELRHDILNGVLRIFPINDDQVIEAQAIIDSVPETPLRALDAIHLAAARSLGASDFATADKFQAQAAESLGFTVHTFY